ncbi:hypothetical protein Bca52824_010882 [Brassica carinata]|uniref:Uncharacterized protein n=1 Tax=Brassica carinata TaxID=52824 RepID=A0A8X7WCH9_BRACI|nr:hypothetical protein Bca52824_010882 [Brassica carinata]
MPTNLHHHQGLVEIGGDQYQAAAFDSQVRRPRKDMSEAGEIQLENVMIGADKRSRMGDNEDDDDDGYSTHHGYHPFHFQFKLGGLAVLNVIDKERRQTHCAEVGSHLIQRLKDLQKRHDKLGILVGKGGLHGNVFRIKPPMCYTKDDAALHKSEAYKHLTNDEDRENMKWLKIMLSNIT